MYVYSFIRINFEKKMYLNPDQLNHRLKCPILLCFLLIYVGCLQNLSKSRLTNLHSFIFEKREDLSLVSFYTAVITINFHKKYSELYLVNVNIEG